VCCEQWIATDDPRLKGDQVMNLRHAGALALIGWYLMVPPLVGDPFWVDADAPISRWEIDSSYDIASDCEAALSRAIRAKGLTESEIRRGVEPGSTAMLSFPLGMAKCIATDDPRLKGD
jgi:hypothetical protein